jgi:hypothetical protein
MFSSPVGKIQPSSLVNPTLCMRRGFFVASEITRTLISSGKHVTVIPSPDHSTNQIAVVPGEIDVRIPKSRSFAPGTGQHRFLQPVRAPEGLFGTFRVGARRFPRTHQTFPTLATFTADVDKKARS